MPSSEVAPATGIDVDERLRGGRSTLRGRVPGISLGLSVVVVAAFFANGAWQRRWIADDGLIVLRTVRNLLAGNGPVFNRGERVEANTSTAWTYLIWFFSWITDGKPEYVVLWIALVLSVLSLPLAMLATARLYRVDRLRSWSVFVPFGALIYIALPPARDFATSGLEVSLCLFWSAGLWWLTVSWCKRANMQTRSRKANARLLGLAFVGGLAPLVRPELALVGGLVLLMVFCTPFPSWWMRVAFVVVAALLPVGYQIFRMGYYGVLVPNTAIAKDASGSKWGQGWTYLVNMFGPYLLLLPALAAVVTGVVLYLVQRRPIGSPSLASPMGDTRLSRYRAGLRTRAAVIGVFVVSGVAEAVYWIHQGGDFMHVRVLLTPLFLVLLPVMVIPLTISTRGAGKPTMIAANGCLLVAWLVVVVWASVTASSSGLKNGTDIGRSGIVDERRYYIQNLGVSHPITAEDYLNYPRMQAMVEAIEEYRSAGGILLPQGDYDRWLYVPQIPQTEPKQLTVYFLNLGMTSMNAPLDVRVVDQMGLAYPLAAHTERLLDARIGHDKDLDAEWVVADSKGMPYHPELSLQLSQAWTLQAREALKCQGTKDLITSYSAPLTWSLFWNNIRAARANTAYRFDRVPVYELERCQLPNPVPYVKDPIRRYGQ